MNAFAYRKILTPRRLRIDYVSPGICEGDFSSTGTEEISLDPLVVHAGPTGLIMEPWFGKYRLRWNRVPGALCYSIYRLADEMDPFSPYILVAECVSGGTGDDGTYETDDGGTYCVTAITPEGETECSNQSKNPGDPDPPPLPPEPPYVPDDPTPVPPVPSPIPPDDIPGSCGNGTPPVPSTLLEDLPVPEVICTVTSNDPSAGSQDFTIPSGKIAAKWVSGYTWNDCTIGVPPQPIKNAFIMHAWFVYDGDITFLGQQYGCYTPTGTPPDCTPDLASQILSDWPDGIIHLNSTEPGELIFDPTDPMVGQTAAFVVPGPTWGASCPYGGPQVMQLLRTKAFIPQPLTLTIDNYSTIKYQLACGSLPSAEPQWDGVIGDTRMVSQTVAQWTEGANGEYAGDCLLWGVDVRYDGDGGKWTIQIIGQKASDLPAGPLTVLFSGEKRYGQTAVGNYGRNGGCSALGCITLV